MLHRHASLFVALILAATAASGCAKQGDTSSAFAGRLNNGSQAQLNASREAALSAMRESRRAEKRQLAEEGMERAERCLMMAPENPGCYYWRAVNTGLYHSVHVIGYQRGVKRMISDCERVNALDPEYENAGAYRMLGQLYTQLPETAGRPDSVTRDVQMAEEHLRRAVQFAPNYPENHLALAEALLAQGRGEEAREALTRSNELAPQWRSDISYDEWREISLALERRLVRSEK